MNFADWIKKVNKTVGLLITPYGEALVHRYYQDALIELSQSKNISTVSIQTNLSCSTDWIDEVDKKTFSLWISYHPNEVDYKTFTNKCSELIKKEISFSIGMVGIKENFNLIKQLKRDIKGKYIWINAYKTIPNYYSKADIDFLTQIDSLFQLNKNNYKTKGKYCSAGCTSFSINDKGDVFPCHFIPQKIGNIYTTNFLEQLSAKKCINETCNCYIGYMNLVQLNLNSIYLNKLSRIIKT